MSPEDKVRVLDLFDRLATYGTQLGWPYTRQIEGKLWELRPQTTLAACRRDSFSPGEIGGTLLPA